MRVHFSQCKHKNMVEQDKFDQTCTISGEIELERFDCETHLKSLLESIIVRKVDNPSSDLVERIKVVAKYF